MAKSDVQFKLTADETDAIKGIKRVETSQRKLEDQFKRTTRRAKKQGTAMSSVGGQFKSFAAGLAGGAGIIAGLHAVTSEIQEGIERTIEFEKQISGLLNLGNNIKNAPAIKQDLLATSSATGFSTGTIANTRFDIQGGGSGLSPALLKKIENEAIEFGLAEGADPDVFSAAILTVVRNAGREFLDNPNLIQSVLFKTVEESRTTNKLMAERVGNFLGVFTAAGFAAKEAFSLIPAATELNLPFETVANVLKNLPKILQTDLAKKFSFDTAGKSVKELFDDVSTLSAQQQTELFGSENLAVGQKLTTDRLKSQAVLGRLGNITPGQDPVGNKLARRRLTDPSFEASRFFKVAQTSRNNVILQKDIATNSFAKEFALRKRGAQEVLPGGLGFASSKLAELSVFGDIVAELVTPEFLEKFIEPITLGTKLRQIGVEAIAFDQLQVPATKLAAQQLLIREYGSDRAIANFQEIELEKIEKLGSALDNLTNKVNTAAESVEVRIIANPNVHTE